MTRRTITSDERKEFEAAFAEARPRVTNQKPQARPKPASVAKAVSTGGLDGRTADRLRRGLLEPHAKLDLHGHTEDAAHRALLRFLKHSQARGHKLVLLVTGRGVQKEEETQPFSLDFARGPRGVLKAVVPRWLREPDFAALIAGMRVAHRRHGGDGAMYIYLRKKTS